jgi:hypothetical protein
MSRRNRQKLTTGKIIAYFIVLAVVIGVTAFFNPKNIPIVATIYTFSFLVEAYKGNS